MQLLAPDILEDASGLSAGVSASALAIGALVWLLGWRGHRFWIVLATTAGAGIVGLSSGPALKTPPLAAGLLLAIAAGALALSLVRVVAFVAGGAALWLAVRALAPAWGEPLVCFLAGGLVGLLLFRVWTMALTSFAGSLLMCYSGLCLAQKLGKVEVVPLAEKHGTLLTAGCIALALAGLIVQFLLDRRRYLDERRRDYRHRPNGQHRSGRDYYDRGQRLYRRAS